MRRRTQKFLVLSSVGALSRPPYIVAALGSSFEGHIPYKSASRQVWFHLGDTKDWPGGLMGQVGLLRRLGKNGTVACTQILPK